MKLRSYAKINLTLDILGKRKDGFHKIDTVLQNINLYDEVELMPWPEDIKIKCNIESLENENNSAVKAAKLLKEKYNVDNGVRIKITKNIPCGSGLAGGSSNAAAVLMGLNEIWDLNLTAKELCKIGSEIGTDVPFHIISCTARGKDRGENITALKTIAKHHVIIIYPDFEINTVEAYSNLNYAKIGKNLASKKLADNIDKFNTNSLHNDFEFSILEKYPKLKEIKSDLGENSLLSGSGSSIFALYKTKEEAERTYKKLKDKYKTIFLTTTMSKKIKFAQEMGYCMGVQRAIDEINKIKGDGEITVLGYLIHNPQVIKELEEQGIKSITDLNMINKGKVVITAHGIADSTIQEARDKGLEVIDLTCPLVTKVHKITKRAQNEGKKVIVYGDKDHTEVKGIVGNLKNYKIISNIDELSEEEKKEPLTFVSQTTKEVEHYDKESKKLKIINKNAEIKDTICYATKDMQSTSIKLAKIADIMIVIGGKISSNTKHLSEICAKFCETKWIETKDEIDLSWFKNSELIGVTAGASTPDGIISSVVDKIQNEV